VFIRAAVSPESEESDGLLVAARDDGSSGAADKCDVASNAVEDDDIGVMLLEWQDPLLAEIYLGLPILP
jgi:hypothetical protein